MISIFATCLLKILISGDINLQDRCTSECYNFNKYPLIGQSKYLVLINIFYSISILHHKHQDENESALWKNDKHYKNWLASELKIVSKWNHSTSPTSLYTSFRQNYRSISKFSPIFNLKPQLSILPMGLQYNRVVFMGQLDLMRWWGFLVVWVWSALESGQHGCSALANLGWVASLGKAKENWFGNKFA